MIDRNNSGPSLKELEDDLDKSPNNIKLVFKIADSHFANNSFDEAFKILIKHYPTNKEAVKEKLLGFFDVLGITHESVITYRKKLSSIMFS